MPVLLDSLLPAYVYAESTPALGDYQTLAADDDGKHWTAVEGGRRASPTATVARPPNSDSGRSRQQASDQAVDDGQSSNVTGSGVARHVAAPQGLTAQLHSALGRAQPLPAATGHGRTRHDAVQVRGLMLMVKTRSACWPSVERTRAVKVNEPAVVGVPEI